MFDKIMILARKRHEKVVGELIEATEKHDDVLKTISDDYIKSKDRVDIPLSEYERLKKENADLRVRCNIFEDVLTRVKIDPNILVSVDPDTVRTFKMINHRDFTTTFRIEFDVPDTYYGGIDSKHVRF